MQGQNVHIRALLTSSDSLEDEEDENLILTSTGGFFGIDVTYGQAQDFNFKPISNTETLSAYITGYDGDEVGTLTIDNPDVQIDINDTADTSDDITLYNPTIQPFTQTVDARITNRGDAGTFALSVVPAGAASLSTNSVTLSNGQPTIVTITPLRVSQSANDVTIVATRDGQQAGSQTMTIVSVVVPFGIRNADTPWQMNDRIPPRTNTPETIKVTPNLSGSGESVNLYFPLVSSGQGVVTIDGNADEDISYTRSVTLSGTVQTSPGNAENLKLTVRVRGQNTVQSNGFSVAAIPVNFSTQLFSKAEDLSAFGEKFKNYLGIVVVNTWKSDSGENIDLDQVEINESVEVASETGVFSHENGQVDVSHHKVPGTNGGVYDVHAVPNRLLNDAGTTVANQIFVFWDTRTGASNIPAPNSGFEITQNLFFAGQTLFLTTTKVGKDVTANHQSSAAGSGAASDTQQVRE
jgi:hypothetical protein